MALILGLHFPLQARTLIVFGVRFFLGGTMRAHYGPQAIVKHYIQPSGQKCQQQKGNRRASAAW